MKALDQITVLDLTRLMPGYTTLILADFGAEVIKIEEPKIGDYFRSMGPKSGDLGYAFQIINRNKKSVKLNLKCKKSIEIFKILVEKSDVLVESFRPGVMKKLGLSYEKLCKINPGIIYCSISGYGQSGPYSGFSGHDVNYLALSGVIGLSKKKDGIPIEPSVPIADFESSQRAALAIFSALFQREKSKKGQFIDIAMFEGSTFWLAQPLAEYFATGTLPDPSRYIGPTDNNWVGSKPGYGIYKTSDGFISIGAAEDKFWNNLCEAIGKVKLKNSREERKQSLKKLNKELNLELGKKTKAYWINKFKQFDVPCMPVNDLSEVVNDPHVSSRNLIADINKKGEASAKVPLNSFGLAENQRVKPKPAPKHGEHTDYVLQKMGISKNMIKELHSSGEIQ